MSKRRSRRSRKSKRTSRRSSAPKRVRRTRRTRRRVRRLTEAQKKRIMVLTKKGGTERSIAKAIGCVPSSIWRVRHGA